MPYSERDIAEIADIIRLTTDPGLVSDRATKVEAAYRRADLTGRFSDLIAKHVVEFDRYNFMILCGVK